MRFNDGKAGIEIWGCNVTDKYYITSIVTASDKADRLWVKSLA